MRYKVINIKNNNPTVERAVLILRGELSTARRLGVQVVKIIHGYGSSGVGGAIKLATHKYIRQEQGLRKIATWCRGEDFDSSTNAGLSLVRLYPELKRDVDYGKRNDGISIIVLR